MSSRPRRLPKLGGDPRPSAAISSTRRFNFLHYQGFEGTWPCSKCRGMRDCTYFIRRPRFPPPNWAENRFVASSECKLCKFRNWRDLSEDDYDRDYAPAYNNPAHRDCIKREASRRTAEVMILKYLHHDSDDDWYLKQPLNKLLDDAGTFHLYHAVPGFGVGIDIGPDRDVGRPRDIDRTQQQWPRLGISVEVRDGVASAIKGYVVNCMLHGNGFMWNELFSGHSADWENMTLQAIATHVAANACEEPLVDKVIRNAFTRFREILRQKFAGAIYDIYATHPMHGLTLSDGSATGL